MDRRKRGRSDDQHEQDGESRPRKQQKGPGRGAALASPWQLTWVRDLPDELNRDAVSLKDLLGDPLISECWEFNFLHDVGFLMDAFDADTRHLVKVHVVHGFWKHEDPNRLALVVSAGPRAVGGDADCRSERRPRLATSGSTRRQCQRCLARTTPR